VSTVLDVGVCLLLVAAAVITLVVGVSAPPAPERPAAATGAERVATLTAAVPAGPDREKHDTLAGHLATAAVANATLDGRPLVESRYPEAVRQATTDRLDDRTHVTARWAACENGPVSGELSAGRRPPPDAEVATATITVHSGLSPAASGSFAALAESLAAAYVGWWFPPGRTRMRLNDARTAAETADRYRSLAETLGVDPGGSVGADPRAANRRLVDALGQRLESDLRGRFQGSEQAAAHCSVERVELVVRGWKP
jgi:hypothetical protein